MSSDLEHWHIDAKVYDDRVEEIHFISDPARNIRRKPYAKVWHVEEYLGRGTFGEVRLERNRNEDKVRAVKRVTTTSSTLSRKECEQELEALLEFSKPKSKDAAIFVEFFGWFQSGFNIYLAMEYIELGDLEKNVQSLSGKLPEAEAQIIAEQILSGLEIMHRASFAHRDLKPQNVLVVIGPPQWWVKLADFGLSKRLTESTAYRTSAGTLPYMAPEILNYLDFTTSGEYTNAVDLWAVGCIIYRLITGIVPFPQGKSLIQYCGDKLLFPNDPLIDCGVTDSGAKFVQQLLVVDPKERLSAAKALQHHWITSSKSITLSEINPSMLAYRRSSKGDNTASIPLNASHASLKGAEFSRSALSTIEYDTVSHAGLKSYGPSTSSETSTLSALRSIQSTASPAASSQITDASDLIPRKPLQQNEVSNPNRIVEKSPKASFNKIGARYEPETTVKVRGNNNEGSPVADNVLKKTLETPETLQAKRLLAHRLFQQKQYQKAEKLNREIVRGWENLLGKEAPKTLESKFLLAGTLYQQRQYQKAVEIYREVARGREKVLGKEDPKTLESKFLVAGTLYMQKQFQEAEGIYREVVRGREKVFGKEDSQTLTSKCLLANTLYEQNQYQKAEELYREVVPGREKVLGKEDPGTLQSKHWLGDTLYRQEQYQKAKEILREVVRAREKVLGKEDPETLRSKHWLGGTLYQQEEYRKAEEILREVVRGREKVLGKEAPDTVESQRLLGEILDRLKQRNRTPLFQALRRALG